MNSGSGIIPQSSVENVNGTPAFLGKEGVAPLVALSPLCCEVLPAIAFKGDAQGGQGEVNRVAPDLVLEDVGDRQVLQHLFSQCLDVGPVAAAPLPGIGRGLPTVLHSIKGSATVGAETLTLSCPIALDGERLAATQANEGGTLRGVQTLTGAVPSDALAAGRNCEGLAAMKADDFSAACFLAALRRAVLAPCGVRGFDGEHLAALRAGFLNLIKVAGARAVDAVRAIGRDVLLSTAPADGSLSRFTAASHRAVESARGLGRLHEEDLATAKASDGEEGILAVVRSFGPCHICTLAVTRHVVNSPSYGVSP